MSDHVLELEVAWRRHVTDDLTLFERLMSRHREKHRRYHTATHVVWVVRHIGELAEHEQVDDLSAVVAAALYHDAIYEPASPANERASARLARRDLVELGWGAGRVGRVATMIEGTAHHDDPPDVDAAVLYDADLAILAADPAGYAEYAANVRAEYRHVEDSDWAPGRSAVLDAFIERESIYATVTGRRLWEHRARANLAAEVAELNR